MQTGLVLKTTGSHYLVLTNGGERFLCTIRGKLRLKGVKTTNPVTVGDRVDIEEESGANGVICNIHERKNYIIRRSSNLSRESHIIAANIDQALLVVTVEYPETQYAFIDRYLVTAEAYRIPVTLIFNKIDLYEGYMVDKLNQYLSVYHKAGYPCLQVSASTGLNLDRFRELLAGRVSLISGNSGVGKSTLINRVEPSLNLKTDQISLAHFKGKHTTTFSEMFALEGGGFIIDTPGIKGFGLIDIDKDELYHFFPEIFAKSKGCKYYNCTHIHEPGCAVIDAVKHGAISETRYLNYIGIYNDDNEKYR